MILPGLSTFSGIENLLDLPQDFIQRPRLPPQELSAAEPIGVFAADRAADAEDLFVQFLGHQPHPLHVVGIVQIEERLDVQLPVAGMAQQRCRDLPAFEHVLRSHQEVGKNFRRDRHVLDHRHRAAAALEPIQQRHGPIRQVQEQLGLFLVEGLAAAEGQSGLLLHAFDQTPHLVAHFLRFVAFELDQHGRFGLGRNQQIEADFALPHQAQMAAIHQIASGRTPWQDQRQRARGLVQAFDTAARPRRDAAACSAWPAWPR